MMRIVNEHLGSVEKHIFGERLELGPLIESGRNREAPAKPTSAVESPDPAMTA